MNPIERIWHIIKNYLQNNYPELMSYDHLRESVKDAWEKVGEQEFRFLIGSMPERCLVPEKAEGKFTKY